MPQNKLEHLKNHLFVCLEELTNPEKPAEMEKTIAKSKAVAAVGGQLINAFKIQLQATKMAESLGYDVKKDFIEIGAYQPKANLLEQGDEPRQEPEIQNS